MDRDESSISKMKSYKDIGAFWDTHDLSDYWDQTQPAEFELDIQDGFVLYALPQDLSEQLRDSARDQGRSPQDLLSAWVKEKLQES